MFAGNLGKIIVFRAVQVLGGKKILFSFSDLGSLQRRLSSDPFYAFASSLCPDLPEPQQ